MLGFLDGAFFIFHTVLIVFNMTGWAWQRTRLLHVIVFGATAFSWFVLGAYYGWGYCICTDWHMSVRERLGRVDPETSYVQLAANRLFGLSMGRGVADWIAGSVFALIVVATATAWIRQWRGRRIGKAKLT